MGWVGGLEEVPGRGRRWWCALGEDGVGFGKRWEAFLLLQVSINNRFNGVFFFFLFFSLS